MYRCTACEREFTSAEALTTHVCETHSDEQEGR
jgi:DNA-directed RNA polymerase subunit RPC12/RpoP